MLPPQIPTTKPPTSAPLRSAAPVEHQRLAHTIKHTHQTLRAESRRLGAKRAWAQHLQNAVGLQRYSSAMRALATRYWEANTARKAGRRTRSSCSTEHNRIAWSVRFCDEYFGVAAAATVVEEDVAEKVPRVSGLLQQREREHRILSEAMSPAERTEAGCEGVVDDDDLWTARPKLRLLDVGSCYNPFVRYEQFDVTAVDIAPAVGSGVVQCDFLGLTPEAVEAEAAVDDGTTTGTTTMTAAEPSLRLRARSFDVVVFCLLLEYLPTSEQRLQCCRNAYALLRPEGVLIVITPDSKHVGANARQIKTWRYALALLGLSRVRVEKLEHLTCMAFRRSPCAPVAQRWARMHREEYMEDALHIPQDFADEVPAVGAGETEIVDEMEEEEVENEKVEDVNK